MGLIKAAVAATKGTLHDQWKDFISCDDLDNDTLMVRVSTDNSIISKSSAIEVKPGQIAVVFDSGKILDATADPGIFTFDSSTSPSFFAGNFGAVFKEMWTRFTYNGGTSKDQAIYYINGKEIIDNKFGTPAPVPYQDWSHPIPNQMTNTITPLRINVKCFGKYTFKIVDPAVFMSEVAGTATVYKKQTICEQMRSEVQASFQNVLNALGSSEIKAPALELPSQTDLIKKMMDEKVFDEKIRERGISISSFIIESTTLDEESNKKIDNYELSSNAYLQQGAYASAIQEAAKNPSGAGSGMLGMGMINMGAGNMFGGNIMQNMENSRMDLSKEQEPEMPKPAETQTEAPAAKFCTNCGTPVTGKFCANCGTKCSD